MLLHLFHEKASVEFNGLPAGICTQPKSKYKYILQKQLMQVIGLRRILVQTHLLYLKYSVDIKLIAVFQFIILQLVYLCKG